MKKEIGILKRIKDTFLPVTLLFIWIMIIVFNSMLFIINTVAFAITSDASFTTQVLECAAFISIGIVGIMNQLKNQKFKEKEHIGSAYYEN